MVLSWELAPSVDYNHFHPEYVVIPIRAKNPWIPVMLLKPPSINRPNPTINAVDGYLPGAQPDDGPTALVRIVNGLIPFHLEPLP